MFSDGCGWGSYVVGGPPAWLQTVWRRNGHASRSQHVARLLPSRGLPLAPSGVPVTVQRPLKKYPLRQGRLGWYPDSEGTAGGSACTHKRTVIIIEKSKIYEKIFANGIHPANERKGRKRVSAMGEEEWGGRYKSSSMEKRGVFCTQCFYL